MSAQRKGEADGWLTAGNKTRLFGVDAESDARPKDGFPAGTRTGVNIRGIGFQAYNSYQLELDALWSQPK